MSVRPAPPLRVSLEDDPSDADRATVLEGLTAATREHAGDANRRPLHLLLRDAAGTVRGGLFGHTAWDWLHVEVLWVAPDVRGGGHGRALVRAAEEEARSRSCGRVYLSTFEFQARAFYERLGYHVHAVHEDFPPGSRRYLMMRPLVDAPLHYS